MAKKKATERKILMPKVKSKIPLKEIRRAVEEVAREREAREKALQTERKR